MTTTSRYIETDAEAQAKLVNMVCERGEASNCVIGHLILLEAENVGDHVIRLSLREDEVGHIPMG